MKSLFTELFKVIPPRDLILAMLVVGLMFLNFHKDKTINHLSEALRNLTNDVSTLSELLRTLVYGRNIGDR